HPFQLFEPDLRRLPVAEGLRERARPVGLEDRLQVVEVRVVKQSLFEDPRRGETSSLRGLAFRPLLNAVRSHAGALDPVSPESRRQHRADEVPERVLGVAQGARDVEFLSLTRGSRDIGFADLCAFQARRASQIEGRQHNAVDRSAFRQHRFQRGLRRRQLTHDAAHAKVSATVGVRHPRSPGLSFGSGCAHWAPLTASLLYRLYRAEPGVEKLRVDRWEDDLLRGRGRRGSYREAANARSCASRSTLRLIWVVTSNVPWIRPQLAIHS